MCAYSRGTFILGECNKFVQISVSLCSETVQMNVRRVWQCYTSRSLLSPSRNYCLTRICIEWRQTEERARWCWVCVRVCRLDEHEMHLDNANISNQMNNCGESAQDAYFMVILRLLRHEQTGLGCARDQDKLLCSLTIRRTRETVLSLEWTISNDTVPTNNDTNLMMHTGALSLAGSLCATHQPVWCRCLVCLVIITALFSVQV